MSDCVADNGKCTVSKFYLWFAFGCLLFTLFMLVLTVSAAGKPAGPDLQTVTPVFLLVLSLIMGFHHLLRYRLEVLNQEVKNARLMIDAFERRLLSLEESRT